ncbi:hypothetical protein IE53DRAFT_365783 [Violaceomyces palustris]|uniref:Uncharacterized protein n=1 Tax=Violaceomyces palustris TaxID=1673888 RepID=A0ACD0P7T5_9BASI|nr:hypothetical protein IE53DRAFT_365783 [Violaceomyces palustris]
MAGAGQQVRQDDSRQHHQSVQPHQQQTLKLQQEQQSRLASAAAAFGGIVTTPPHASSETGYPTPQTSEQQRRLAGSDDSEMQNDQKRQQQQQQQVAMGMQLDGQHTEVRGATNSSNATTSAVAAPNWAGMVDLAYIQHGGAYASDQFSPQHAFMYQQHAVGGAAAHDGTMPRSHTASAILQANGHHLHGHGHGLANDPHLSQQAIFNRAQASFQQPGPNNPAGAMAGDFDSAKNGNPMLGQGFDMSIPTPPDSSRRAGGSRPMAMDLEPNASPDQLGGAPGRQGRVNQRSKAGQAQAQVGRQRRGAVQAAEMESPSPTGLAPPRQLQGSPTPAQRPEANQAVGSNGKPQSMRSFAAHRSSQSLGQAGQIMSNNGQPSPGLHMSAPVSPIGATSTGPSGFGQALQMSTPTRSDLGAQHHMQAQVLANSVMRPSGNHFTARSSSPTDSATSTSVTPVSQHGQTAMSPFASSRFNAADSSFGSQDTSTDSFSNSAASASASVSRASSTSDEFFTHDFGTSILPASMRMTKRKRKLLNIDRKLICDFHTANPNVKQDAIANRFGIERSTVSKILKQKEKWLAIDPDSESARIAKHRAAKFPQVEDRLSEWVAQAKAEGKVIHDVMIRSEALRIAKEIGLTVDKFKASGGWIEKFRERNMLPKAVAADVADIGLDSPASSSISAMDTDELQRQTSVTGSTEYAQPQSGSTELGLILPEKRDGAQEGGAARLGAPAELAPQTPGLAEMVTADPMSGGRPTSASEATATTPVTSTHPLRGGGDPAASSQQTTPTSAHKRQYDAMASGHVSPLNSNMARMQFGSNTPDSAHQLQLTMANLDSSQSSQQQMSQSNGGGGFDQRSNGGPGCPNLDERNMEHTFEQQQQQQHQYQHQQQDRQVDLDAVHQDGPVKRRRAEVYGGGPGLSAVGQNNGSEQQLMLGSAFEDRQLQASPMDTFHFPSTPVNHGRARLPSQSDHGQLGMAGSNQGSFSSAVSPLGDLGTRQGYQNLRGQSQRQQTEQVPSNGTRTRPHPRHSYSIHIPGASSPLTRSPQRASFEDPKEAQMEIPQPHSLSQIPSMASNGAASMATVPSATVGVEREEVGDSAIVTAEQAQQSLELVLRFLSEQPGNFLPASHFVVFGHLQANIEQLIRERVRSSCDDEGEGGNGGGGGGGGPSRMGSRAASPK